METSNKQSTYISELLESLSEDNLAMVDFDQHRAWLRNMMSELPELYQADRELNILRQDYMERIAGMAKALAVVNRRHNSLKETLAYLETLAQMEATELVEQYRLVSARFRDSFPASFGMLAPQRKKLRNKTGSEN